MLRASAFPADLRVDVDYPAQDAWPVAIQFFDTLKATALTVYLGFPLARKLRDDLIAADLGESDDA